MKDFLRTMAVAALWMVVWGAGAAAGQGASDSRRKPEGIVKIRLGGMWAGWSNVRDVAERFRIKNPQIGFEYADRKRPSRLLVKDLTEGRIDVAVLNVSMLSGDLPGRRGGAPQRDWVTTEALKKAKCPAKVIGWHVMAVVVHPKNPLREIDEAMLRKVLGHRITSWKSLGWQDVRINLILDGRVASVICELTGQLRLGTCVFAPRIPRALNEFAKDRFAMGMFCVDKRLTDSGLKILPIRRTGVGQALLPSTENVSSGKYPYYHYLAVATRGGAPQIARSFAKYLQGPETADALDTYGYWLTELDYTLPGEPVEEIWPAPDPRADPIKVSGAVAVLPLEPLSAHFLMADSSHHAVYEQAVADGIAKDRRLKMVNRAELARVLKERKAALMSGSTRPASPIITADVLVLSYVTTKKSQPYLLVRAVHAATASTLGRMKLAIDPAKPAKFRIPISQKVAQWWPGVLRNLVAARTKPVWTLLPMDSGKQQGRDKADRVQASLRKVLSADERIFFAEYGTLPETQQEVLMRLMGISRSAGGRFTPAGDYLIECRARPDAQIELHLLRGSDLKVLRKTTLKGASIPADASAWTTQQIKLFPKVSRPTTPAVAGGKVSARKQAQLQTERGLRLRKQYETLHGQAYKRYRAKGLSHFTPEDKKELDRLKVEMTRCFERAAQLDPTLEKAAYEAAMAANKSMDGSYASILRVAEKCSFFVDTFPKSSRLRGMMERTTWAYSGLTRYLESPGLRDSALVKAPRGLDYAKLARQYRRRTLYYLSEYMKRFIRERDKRGGGSFYTFSVMVKMYYGALWSYTKLGASGEEMEEVAAEYGRAVDQYPEVLKHSDFHRLRYFAMKQRKQAYIELLSAMQKRWPDPKDVHWKLGKDEALEGLCNLFKTDRRRTSFYQWLRGKRGIGDLPYVGYDPNKKGPKGKGGT